MRFLIILVLILCGLKTSNQVYVNVALNKPAYLSSIDENSSEDHSANVGVDGVITGMSYVKTQTSSDPSLHWFVVDLLNKYVVDHVVVYNRRVDLDTISQFIVGLSNNFDPAINTTVPMNNLHLCGQYKNKGQPPGNPMMVNCSKILMKWRFVVLKQSFMVRGSMGFSEIEVYTSNENYLDLYIGCFSLLTNQVSKAFTSHTISDCLAVCSQRNNYYAFISRGDECSCGNILNSLSISSAYCNLPCISSNEKCGGPFATSVYSVKLSYGVNSYYQGCFEVLPNFRSIFSKSSISFEGVNAEECLKFCLTKNFEIAAIQADRICYCGGGWDNLHLFKKANKELCERKCSKSIDNHCGGENALSLYTGCLKNVLGLQCANFSHCLHFLQPLHSSTSDPENYEKTTKIQGNNGVDSIINSDGWVFYVAPEEQRIKTKKIEIKKMKDPEPVVMDLDFTQVYSKMCYKTECQLGWKGYACHLRDCSVNNGNCGRVECLEAQVSGVWVGECVCEKGYTRRHYMDVCVDIDECTSNLDLCPANHLCVNIEGSYVCKKIKGNDFEDVFDVLKGNTERVNEEGELSRSIDREKRRYYYEKTKRNIEELINEQEHIPGREQKFLIRGTENDENTIKDTLLHTNEYDDFLVYVGENKKNEENEQNNLNKNHLSKRNLMDFYDGKVYEGNEVEDFADSPENIINLDLSYNDENDFHINNNKFTVKIDFDNFKKNENKNEKNFDNQQNKVHDYNYNLHKFKTRFKDRVKKTKKTKVDKIQKIRDFHDMSEDYNDFDSQEKDYNAKPIKPLNDIYDHQNQFNKNLAAIKNAGAERKSMGNKSNASMLVNTDKFIQDLVNTAPYGEESTKVNVLVSLLTLLFIILIITSTFLYKHFRKKDADSNSGSEHETPDNTLSEYEEKMISNFPNVAYSEVISSIRPLKQDHIKQPETSKNEQLKLEKILKPEKSSHKFLKINKEQLLKGKKNEDIMNMLTYVKEAENRSILSNQAQKSNMLLVLPKRKESTLKKVDLSFFKVNPQRELKPSSQSSFPDIWKTLYKVNR